MKLQPTKLLPIAAVLTAFLFVILFMMSESIFSGLLIILLAASGAYVVWRTRNLRENIQSGFKQHGKSLYLLIGLFILLFPFFFLRNAYIIHILTLSFIYAIAVIGLNIQIGSTDIVNFAQGAFMGIGGYTSALLTVNLDLSFWFGLIAAIVISGLFGLLLGLPTLKTREFHLSLVTIAFAYIAYLLILNMKWTGGPNGIVSIPKPELFGFSFATRIVLGNYVFSGTFFYYYLVLIALTFSFIIARRLHYSWLGLGWNAIRDDEIAARCYGVNFNLIKLSTFIIGAAYAGLAGCLYAHFVGFISPESLTFSLGLTMVGMVILGGMDNIGGVILGAVLLIIIPEKFRAFQDFRLLFYGVVIILMLLFRPAGLIPKRVRFYRSKKERIDENK
jgi:ABC-type branched-subunit amino acid transport system permease subunit